jgi:hypothetical protein
MRRTIENANALIGKNARTSADTKNQMTSKRFKSSLRLIAVILMAFLAARFDLVLAGVDLSG